VVERDEGDGTVVMAQNQAQQNTALVTSISSRVNKRRITVADTQLSARLAITQRRSHQCNFR